MKNLLIALSALLVVALMTVGLVLTFTPDNHVHEYTSAVEKAATCTSNGKMLYTCSCGKNYAEKIDALGHSFVNYLSDGNATCTADGTLTAKCDRCDATDTKTDAGSMIDHTYDAYANNGDDHTKSCDCGSNISEAHIWEETNRVYATHTEDGSADYACVCGATKHEVLPMLVGCEYNQEVEDWLYLKSSATCTEAAVFYKSCVCGEYSDAEDASTFVVGEPNGHSNDPWTLGSVDAEAQTAVLTYNCWDCGEDVTLTVNFADCEKTGTPATCEADGNETVTYVYYIGADKHELVVYSGTVTKLGHAYGTPAYTWSEDLSSCTATTTCANDASHVLTETVTVNVNVIDPKCFVGGKTIYTASFANDMFAQQTKEGNETSALGAHTWNGTSCTVCNATKFEAETFELINVTTDKSMIGSEGKTPEATNYPSGDAFVYNLQYSLNTTLKFEVTSSAAQKATLTFRMGCRQYTLKPSETFVLKVNGAEVAFNDAEFPIYTDKQYYDWVDLAVATIDLNAGNNVIELVRTTSDHALNFDYVSVIPTEGTVSDPREANGHSYEWICTTVPTYEAAGSAYAYCAYCRDYQLVDLPIVSAANGYEQLSHGAKSVWKYTTANGNTILVEVAEEATKYPFLVTKDDDIFTNVVDNNGPDTTGKTTNKDSNSYGIFYEVTQGATFTLKVNAAEATNAVFVLTLRGNSVGDTYLYSDIVKSLYINNTAANISSGGVVLTGWYEANNTPAEIAIIDLVAGENTITFTMGDLNVNIVGFQIYAFAEITHEPTKIFHGGKIADVDPVTKNGSKDNTPVTDATNGVYYQNNQGATFTMTFTSDKAVDAVLFLDMTSTNNKAYAVSSILTSITVNGVEVDLNDVGTITTKNWNAANDVKATLAVFSLKEGTNTITFVFGSNNINISGIQLLAACDITFSKN